MRTRRLAARVFGPGALVAIAIALGASSARSAEGRTSSLSWNRMPGADECIATQALARAVEERLGRPGKVFVSAAQADVSVEGRIEKKRGGGWHAIIQVRDEKANGASLGTRELDRDDASCDAMSEPLAFVIAVMIDPEAAMARRNDPTPTASVTATATATAPPPPASSTAPPPPPPTATEKPPPRKQEPWRFEGGVDGTAAAGLTPGVAPGAGVYGILFPPGIPLGFRGFSSIFPSVFGSNSVTKDGATGTFDMILAGGTLCPTLRARVNLMFCLGGSLGVLRPRAETPGRGISEALLLLWNVNLELRTSFTIVSPIGATAGVGMALPILRPEVTYDDATGGGSSSLFKVSPIAGMADLGIGFVFP